jgi:hypothetical protein
MAEIHTRSISAAMSMAQRCIIDGVPFKFSYDGDYYWLLNGETESDGRGAGPPDAGEADALQSLWNKLAERRASYTDRDELQEPLGNDPSVSPVSHLHPDSPEGEPEPGGEAVA